MITSNFINIGLTCYQIRRFARTRVQRKIRALHPKRLIKVQSRRKRKVTQRTQTRKTHVFSVQINTHPRVMVKKSLPRGKEKKNQSPT
jgi:hypothetical protein